VQARAQAPTLALNPTPALDLNTAMAPHPKHTPRTRNPTGPTTRPPMAPSPPNPNLPYQTREQASVLPTPLPRQPRHHPLRPLSLRKVPDTLVRLLFPPISPSHLPLHRRLTANSHPPATLSVMDPPLLLRLNHGPNPRLPVPQAPNRLRLTVENRPSHPLQPPQAVSGTANQPHLRR
jgi:hypothetical protein